jgi:hypothetical protein
MGAATYSFITHVLFIIFINLSLNTKLMVKLFIFKQKKKIKHFLFIILSLGRETLTYLKRLRTLRE